MKLLNQQDIYGALRQNKVAVNNQCTQGLVLNCKKIKNSKFEDFGLNDNDFLK